MNVHLFFGTKSLNSSFFQRSFSSERDWINYSFIWLFHCGNCIVATVRFLHFAASIRILNKWYFIFSIAFFEYIKSERSAIEQNDYDRAKCMYIQNKILQNIFYFIYSIIMYSSYALCRLLHLQICNENINYNKYPNALTFFFGGGNFSLNEIISDEHKIGYTLTRNNKMSFIDFSIIFECVGVILFFLLHCIEVHSG